MSKKDDCEAMSYTYTYIYTHKIKFLNEWREREREREHTQLNHILQNAFEKMKIMARVGTARHG